MALTIAQQRDIYKLAVGMYNAAPGVVYINELANAVEAGLSMTSIYNILANSASFQTLDFDYTDAATNTQFATQFVDNLTDGTLSAANRTFAINYVNGLLNSGASRGTAMQTAIDALDAVPTTDANFGAAAALLDNRVNAAIYYTETLSGNDTDVGTLQTKIALVTSDPASVTVQNTTNAGIEVIGDSFTLTDGVDDVNGTPANDTINGIFGDASATLTAGDDIDGAGGTDTLSLVATGTTASAVGVTVTNVETINIKDFSGATFNALLVASNPAINFTDTIAGNTSIVTNAGQGNTYGLKGAGNLTVDFASTSGTADTAKVALLGAGTSTSARSTIDVSDGNTIELATVALSGTNFATLNFGTAAAKATFTGSGTNNLTIGTMAILSTLDAGATTGTNTFGLGTTLSTGDVVIGGTGADTLSANFKAASLLNPTVSGVETLALDFDADAIFNLSKTTGATTVTISGSVGNATLTNAAADLTKINVTTQDAAFTDGDLTFSHATGVTGALTLTLGTTATSATDVKLDTVTLKGTTSLTLSTTGTKDFVIDELLVDQNQSAVTINVAADSSLRITPFNAQGNDIGALSVTVGADGEFSGTFQMSGGSLGDVTFSVGAGGSGDLSLITASGGGDIGNISMSATGNGANADMQVRVSGGSVGNVSLTVAGSDASGSFGTEVSGGSIGDIAISVTGNDAQAFWNVSANAYTFDSGEDPAGTGNIGNVTISVDGDNVDVSGSMNASGGDIGNISITMTGDGMSGSMEFDAVWLSGDVDNDGSTDDYVQGGNIGNITVNIDGTGDTTVETFFLASGGNIGDVNYSFNGASGILYLTATSGGSGGNDGSIGAVNITLGDNVDFSGFIATQEDSGSVGAITIIAGTGVSGELGISGGGVGDLTVTLDDNSSFQIETIFTSGGDVGAQTATIGDDAYINLQFGWNSDTVGPVTITGGASSLAFVNSNGGVINAMDMVTLKGGDDAASGGVFLNDNITVFGGVDASAWLGQLGVDLSGVQAGTLVLTGAGGSHVTGTGFADNIFGGAGKDSVDAGNGADLVLGGGGADTINGGNDADTINGDAGGDTLNGDDGKDTIDGGAGNDKVNGGAKDDTLAGGADSDTIAGDAGVDNLTGGTGTDTFKYAAAAATDTGITWATADVITDFTAADDSIDLTTAGSVTNYAEADGTAFADEAATLAAANTALDATILYYLAVNVAGSGNGFLYIDDNADGTADAVIQLNGVNLLTEFAFGDIT